MKKFNIKSFILGIIFSITFGVSATFLYNAKDISFTPNDDNWNVDNVESALEDIKNNYYSSKEVNDLLTKVSSWNFTYTGGVQSFTVPLNGKYKIELWGAYNGGYTSGEIDLDKDEIFYIYVGQGYSYCSSNVTSFNGGGASKFTNSYCRGTSGGGATDIRLVSGDWNDLSSLRSRIMVAAGGGGGSEYAGVAGGLTGYSGSTNGTGGGGSGASQTSGGTSNNASNGTFGIGATSTVSSGTDNAGSGGGGYYGGGAGYDVQVSAGGGGGSSFISGHNGCVAITSESDTTPKSGCTNGTTNIECSYHYSNKIFTNTVMIDGAGYSWTTVKGSQTGMPTLDGTSTMTTNTGNGYAKITLISVD